MTHMQGKEGQCNQHWCI